MGTTSRRPAGLTVQRIHFGIRDAFTYVIMVARKN